MIRNNVLKRVREKGKGTSFNSKKVSKEEALFKKNMNHCMVLNKTESKFSPRSRGNPFLNLLIKLSSFSNLFNYTINYTSLSPLSIDITNYQKNFWKS